MSASEQSPRLPIPVVGVPADAGNRLAGIGMLALSTFVFAFSNVLAKWSTGSYPAGEALFIRAGISLLLVLPVLRLDDLIVAVRLNPGLHTPCELLAPRWNCSASIARSPACNWRMSPLSTWRHRFC